MRRTLLILPALCGTLSAPAQRLTVVLDAARGGSEYGARIDAHTYEKQVTLDLANRLRSLLAARDFNVVLTRETDSQVSNEQRAAIANQSKAVACVLLDATAAGSGVHLWTSSLNPQTTPSYAVPWDEAQAPFVLRSQRLAPELAAAFSRSSIAVSTGHTWIRPLDNMECPAVAVEVAPRDGDTPASDRAYQTRVAEAIASELLLWRSHVDLVQSILNPPPPPAPPKPEPKPGSAIENNGAEGPGTATSGSSPAAIRAAKPRPIQPQTAPPAQGVSPQ